jgi:hypothetical protein
MRKFIRVFALITVVVVPLTLSGSGTCNPPFGYTWVCGSQCGTVGTCDKAGAPSDICMLSYEAWGCFWDSADPCCTSGSGF